MSFLARDDAQPVGAGIHGASEHRHPLAGIVEGDAVLRVHTGRSLHASRLRAFDVRAEQHGREVKRVDAHVEQCAPGQLGLLEPFYLADGVSEVGCQQVGIPDDAAAERVGNLPREGHVAGPDGFGDEHVALFGQAQQGFGLCGVGRESFFAKHGLPRFDALACLLVVVRVRRGDVYQVHFRVVDECLVRAVCPFEMPLACELLRLADVARSDGVARNVAHSVHGGGHCAGNASGSDDSYFVRFHVL